MGLLPYSKVTLGVLPYGKVTLGVLSYSKVTLGLLSYKKCAHGVSSWSNIRFKFVVIKLDIQKKNDFVNTCQFHLFASGAEKDEKNCHSSIDVISLDPASKRLEMSSLSLECHPDFKVQPLRTFPPPHTHTHMCAIARVCGLLRQAREAVVVRRAMPVRVVSIWHLAGDIWGLHITWSNRSWTDISLTHKGHDIKHNMVI